MSNHRTAFDFSLSHKRQVNTNKEGEHGNTISKKKSKWWPEKSWAKFDFYDVRIALKLIMVIIMADWFFFQVSKNGYKETR